MIVLNFDTWEEFDNAIGGIVALESEIANVDWFDNLWFVFDTRLFSDGAQETKIIFDLSACRLQNVLPLCNTIDS